MLHKKEMKTSIELKLVWEDMYYGTNVLILDNLSSVFIINCINKKGQLLLLMMYANLYLRFVSFLKDLHLLVAVLICKLVMVLSNYDNTHGGMIKSLFFILFKQNEEVLNEYLVVLNYLFSHFKIALDFYTNYELRFVTPYF